MSIWTILKNLGSIISLFKTFSALISGVATTKSMPSKDMIKAVLDQIEDLLDRGVIDIPNVDEKAISDALKQIEEVVCK